MPLFDKYVIVDWSAANQPKKGKDSIWIAEKQQGNDTSCRLQNISTRIAAFRKITSLCQHAVTEGERVFIGFDFAFGYPVGSAERLCASADWRALWRYLQEHIVDSDSNQSNRFEFAEDINIAGFHGRTRKQGPYWGHPHQQNYEGLQPSKPLQFPKGIKEKRLVEERVPAAKSVWQLAYNGSVGSQTLLGLPLLNEMRHYPSLKNHIAIWPFETHFSGALEKLITIAEIYPSAYGIEPEEGEVLDATQVRTVAEGFAHLDSQNQFGVLLSRPPGLSKEEYNTVIREEGWIVGAGHKGDTPEEDAQ